MGYFRFNFKSRALGRYVDVTITLPTEKYAYSEDNAYSRNHAIAKKTKLLEPNMKFQTLYLLHGGGDDDTMVTRYTNVERYARENFIMTVTPNIVDSYGVNARYGIEYFTFVTEELPIVVQTLFPSSPYREDNFIAGFAMGGNIALAAAIMHPEKYAVCCDMSGGIGYTLDTENLKSDIRKRAALGGRNLFVSAFGDPDQVDGSDLDLYYYAKKFKEENRELTKFYVICGSDEFVRERIEKDVKKLEELGYDYKYIVPEGYTHDWPLWDKYLGVIINELLPLKKDHIVMK